MFGTLVGCRTRRNLTGGSQIQIRRGLAQARRLMLASQIDEALGAIEHVELQLDDVPPAAAQRFRAAAQVLRAAGLAFQDNSRGALSIALSHLKADDVDGLQHAAAALCRLGCWHLGKFDAFHSLPRTQPRAQWSKSQAISAVLDLSIEAWAAFDQLHIHTAKRLAFDASTIAEAAPGGLGGLSVLPACLTAQVLYEEGLLDQAGRILRDCLPTINAEGSVDCALRAYIILARIAGQRTRHDLAALLLREAEALGERRGWPRLVAACLAERARLMLQRGLTMEARLCFEQLDRLATTHGAGSGHANAEITRYRTLTRWRVSWAEAPSVEAVAAMRQLHRLAIKRDLYRGCRMAVELAEMLAGIGETEEADALMLQTLQAGAAAGLYQAFLDGGEGSGDLLRRAYARCGALGSESSGILPILGSLLSQWNAHYSGGRSPQPSNNAGDTLSAREWEILGLIGEGFPNKRIAKALAISPETVKSHIKRIFQKLAAGTRAEAVCRARLLRLL
ncbi:MAG: LuxR C-terminal-related transcriptional regulator [Inquilinus sp.]|uniref:LuxR C-terminal-related transcriptional regulator n=1 Tax=Inquilinus sp. TaxID=1932117 RepID=UPI003F2D0D07